MLNLESEIPMGDGWKLKWKREGDNKDFLYSHVFLSVV